MFRLRSANFRITGLPDGLADLIFQSREVPSQFVVATQRPSGGLTATSKLHPGAPFSTSNPADRAFSPPHLAYAICEKKGTLRGGCAER